MKNFIFIFLFSSFLNANEILKYHDIPDEYIIHEDDKDISYNEIQNEFNKYNQTHEENFFIKYGKKYNISPLTLWAIAKTESNFNIYAVNKNKNGTYDIGLMQINTVHLPTLKKFGITYEMLYNPEISIDVGGWVLANCIKKHGNTWKAINCYNGRIKNNNYVNKVVNNANLGYHGSK